MYLIISNKNSTTLEVREDFFMIWWEREREEKKNVCVKSKIIWWYIYTTVIGFWYIKIVYIHYISETLFSSSMYSIKFIYIIYDDSNNTEVGFVNTFINEAQINVIKYSVCLNHRRKW